MVSFDLVDPDKLAALTDATDCDDTDKTVYPGNLSATEGDGGCYLDADGDGYGDDSPANSSIASGSDCDDSDASS